MLVRLDSDWLISNFFDIFMLRSAPFRLVDLFLSYTNKVEIHSDFLSRSKYLIKKFALFVFFLGYSIKSPTKAFGNFEKPHLFSSSFFTY